MIIFIEGYSFRSGEVRPINEPDTGEAWRLAVGKRTTQTALVVFIVDCRLELDQLIELNWMNSIVNSSLSRHDGSGGDDDDDDHYTGKGQLKLNWIKLFETHDDIRAINISA